MKVWAAAAIRMGILAWVVAPLLARIFSGAAALPRALILTLGAGLIWQFALVLIVVRREQGSLRWPVLKKALWLNAPISPRTGKRSNRLWWMIIPLMVLLALEEVLPALPTPATRDASCSNASSVEPLCDNGPVQIRPGLRGFHNARRRRRTAGLSLLRRLSGGFPSDTAASFEDVTARDAHCSAFGGRAATRPLS